MCELLGLNANVPTDICFSFAGLLERGGRTGPHKDGWGICFYEGKTCRSFHDPEACSDSPIATLIAEYPIKSNITISHIRLANSGKVNLANTHPFTRELWGRRWCFAHNGQLKGVKKLPLNYFNPIGTTDSEHAFCVIMDKLKAQFERLPSASQLYRALNTACSELQDMGVFNILLSDSRQLYVYSNTKLFWIQRKAPFGKAQLSDAQVQIDFGNETTENDVVSVIATEPLTKDEVWHRIDERKLCVFRDGEKLK
jgi:glutamine amidotransferase